MTIPIWPTTLPQQIMVESYKEGYPNNLLRSESDAGGAKVRKKGATPPFKISVEMLLSYDQRDILKEFVRDTLMDGALRFVYKHPIDLYNFEARLIPQGEDLYAINPETSGFSVSLQLEILP